MNNVVHNIYRKNYTKVNEQLQTAMSLIMERKLLDMKKTIAANIQESPDDMRKKFEAFKKKLAKANNDFDKEVTSKGKKQQEIDRRLRLKEGLFHKKRRTKRKGVVGKIILQLLKNREQKHKIKAIKAQKELIDARRKPKTSKFSSVPAKHRPVYQEHDKLINKGYKYHSDEFGDTYTAPGHVKKKSA